MRRPFLYFLLALVLGAGLFFGRLAVAGAVPKWHYEHHLERWLKYNHPHKNHYGVWLTEAGCASEHVVRGAHHRWRRCGGHVFYKRDVCVRDICETVSTLEAYHLFYVNWLHFPRSGEVWVVVPDHSDNWHWHS